MNPNNYEASERRKTLYKDVHLLGWKMRAH